MVLPTVDVAYAEYAGEEKGSSDYDLFYAEGSLAVASHVLALALSHMPTAYDGDGPYSCTFRVWYGIGPADTRLWLAGVLASTRKTAYEAHLAS